MNVNLGPSARFSAAGDCLDPNKGILVFIGGCNASLEALDDMFYLYTGLFLNYPQVYYFFLFVRSMFEAGVLY